MCVAFLNKLVAGCYFKPPAPSEQKVGALSQQLIMLDGISLSGHSHTVTRDESFPYQLGRVVERPLELNLGGIGLHPAEDVHQLALGDSVDDGVRVSTDRDV